MNIFRSKLKRFNVTTIIQNRNQSYFFKIVPEIGTRAISKQLNNLGDDPNDKSLFINAHAIAKEILNDSRFNLNSQSFRERFKQILDHVNLGGRCRRFNIFMHTYRYLSPGTSTNEHLLRISMMGYLVEMLCSTFIVVDDVIDRATLRRNKLPLYKISGRTAILDVLALHSYITNVITLFFQQDSHYAKFIELFNKTSWVTMTSGYLDMIYSEQQTLINMENYRKMVYGKMTLNAFHLPIITAVHLANYEIGTEEEKFAKIVDDIGYFSLIENDYNDRYGKTSGKVLDDDIRERKRSWLLMTALEKADDQQKDIINKNYGKKDAKNVQAVIDVYDQLGMEEITNTYKRHLVQAINENINTLHDRRLQDILKYALELIDYWYRDKN